MSTGETGTVVINDVGPRDGLQNQTKVLAPAERVRLVRALLNSGVKQVEVGSFVSPKAVPAMVGADEALDALSDVQDATLTVLIPNVRGYELAMAAGAKSICMVLYGSEGMAHGGDPAAGRGGWCACHGNGCRRFRVPLRRARRSGPYGRHRGAFH